MPLPRCAGCNRTSNARPLVGPGPIAGQRRCAPCQGKNKLWQACGLHGCPVLLDECEPIPTINAPCRDATPDQIQARGVHACQECVSAYRCTLQQIVPPHAGLEGTESPAKTLAGAHKILRREFDIWLCPIRDRCMYHWARVILWRRFSVLAGIVPGPSGKKPGCGPAIAQHVTILKRKRQWPVTTDAKIVLVGIDTPAIPNIAALTPEERDRLYGCERSLTRSANGNSKGLDWNDFNRNPTAARYARVRLVRLLAEMLTHIEVTSNGRPGLNNGAARTWDGATPKERVFRASLHASPADIVRFQP